MNQDEIIKTLKAEQDFFMGQLRKLNSIIRNQEEQIADLRMANQDLKHQLTEMHEALSVKQDIDEIDDGRC
jgi:SMC interacting uncharacterized protein involved in chromosome segregation